MREGAVLYLFIYEDHYANGDIYRAWPCNNYLAEARPAEVEAVVEAVDSRA
jgi:hypothetical protein